MPVTRIEFSAGGLIDGWSSADVEALDMQATETKLIGILRDLVGAPNAEVAITWESTADKIFGSWDYASEQEEAYEALRDYEWYDAQKWGEFTYLHDAGGNRVY